MVGDERRMIGRGIGCQMQLRIKGDRIYRVEAPFDSAPILARMTLHNLNSGGQPAEH